MLRADNTATLSGAMNFQASFPSDGFTGAEVSLRLAVLETPHLWAQHVAGSLTLWLILRLQEGDNVPVSLQDATKVAVPLRNHDFCSVIRRNL